MGPNQMTDEAGFYLMCQYYVQLITFGAIWILTISN